MNKETSKQARIIDDALIAEYRQAVTKFNEEIKKMKPEEIRLLNEVYLMFSSKFIEYFSSLV